MFALSRQEISEQGGAIGEGGRAQARRPHGAPCEMRYNRDMSLAFILSFSPFRDRACPTAQRIVGYVYESDAFRRSSFEMAANLIRAHLRANGPSQRDALIKAVSQVTGVEARDGTCFTRDRRQDNRD